MGSQESKPKNLPEINYTNNQRSINYRTNSAETVKSDEAVQYFRVNNRFNKCTVSRPSSTEGNITSEKKETSRLQFTDRMCNTKVYGSSDKDDEIAHSFKTDNVKYEFKSLYPNLKPVQESDHHKLNLNVEKGCTSSERKITSVSKTCQPQVHQKTAKNNSGFEHATKPAGKELTFPSATPSELYKLHYNEPETNYCQDDMNMKESNLNLNIEKVCTSSERTITSVRKTCQTQDQQNTKTNNLQINSGFEHATKSTPSVTTSEVYKLQYNEHIKHPEPETNYHHDDMDMKRNDGPKINTVPVTETTRNYFPSAPMVPQHNSSIHQDLSYNFIGNDDSVYQDNINSHQFMDNGRGNYQQQNKYHSANSHQFMDNARGNYQQQNKYHNANSHQFMDNARGNYQQQNKYHNANSHQFMDNARGNYQQQNKYHNARGRNYSRGRVKKNPNNQSQKFHGQGRGHNFKHLKKQPSNHNNMKTSGKEGEPQFVDLTNINYYSSMESVASALSQNEFGSSSNLSDNKSNRGGMQNKKKLYKYNQKHFNDQELSITENQCAENTFFNKNNEPFDRRKWKSLRDLSVTNPDDVVKLLINQHDFYSIFNEELEFEDVVLVSNLLSNISNSTDITKSIILWHTIKPEFLNQIVKFIISLHIEYNKESVDTVTAFVFNITTYFYSLILLFPQVGSYIQDVNQKLDVALKMFELQHKVQLRSSVNTIIKNINTLIDNSSTQKTENLFICKENSPHNQVISDFRRVNINPSLKMLNYDVVNSKNTRYLFTTVNDYLEHCFKSECNLLLDSIREAYNYAHSHNRRHRKTVFQLHTNIEFGPKIGHSENKYVLIFGKNNALLNSKQFSKGSLLFLTEDSFASILFASVHDVHPKYLSNGRVIVKLLNWEDWKCLDFQTKKFELLETSIRYNNYECVLKGLQNKSLLAQPMYEYFINHKHIISKPSYINKEKKDICFNIDSNNEEFCTEYTWKLDNCKDLDTSQIFALKTALSNEFTLIRGGPGTGKTFLCVNLIRAFLVNSSVWSRNKIPILVILENRDVLDHFLELLIKIENNVLSLGGIPQNKTLKCHNMYYKINEMKSLIHMEQEVAQRKQMLMNLSKDIDIINSNAGIISIKSFEKHIHKDNLKCFILNDSLNDTLFIKWLTGVKYDEAMAYQEQYTDFHYVQNYSEVITAISFTKLKNKISEIDGHISNILNESLHLSLKRKHSELSLLLNILKTLVNTSCEPLSEEKVSHVNLWNLVREKRWNLYCYWRTKFVDDMLERQCHQKKLINILENTLQKVKHEMEMKLINESSVVVLTVSDALHLQSTLQSIMSKIVIVNEADRISDPELILSIPYSCQHLILFGDENVNEIHLPTQKLSLFYSMCNAYNYVTLTTQHRMIPEISNMVLQHFYETDSWNIGSKVSNISKKVLGIKSNMVFINHDNIEKQEHKMLSFINDYEADFVVALCQYLLFQGYSQNEITILSMYGAQAQCIQNKIKQLQKYNGVTIKSVDNFKGRESRIIILSLVRNNDLGWLQNTHKVAMAFSRAREGLYVIGCLNRLSTKSPLWKSIQRSMLCQDLVLQCQIHRNQELVVTNPDDFENWTEGSCQQICEKQLTCGHICKFVCHLNDRNHANNKCHEPCKRSADKCPYKHRCPKMCLEDCGPCKEEIEKTLPCGHTVTLECGIQLETYHCNVEVSVELPCGHKGSKNCHQETPIAQCKSMCENRLPCGHQCSKKCHFGNDPDHLHYICMKPCVKRRLGCTMDHKCQKKCHEQCEPCTEMVNKKLPCDHSRKIKCNKNTKDVKCLKKCKKLLTCGHLCKLICSEVCSSVCHEPVQKKLPVCGHCVPTKCSEQPDPKMCVQPCQKILSCSHQCQNKCNEKCTTDCKAIVITDKFCPYGHKMSIDCSLQNNEFSQEMYRRCTQPCQTELLCGHICQGTCGSCFQGRVHKPCQEDCGKTLICGHICDTPCPSNCPPCEKRCSFSCSHSKCSKLCGEPCTPCIEKCVSACVHSQCTKLCYELCDREPCTQPCLQRLKCNHKCIGFCGEPCPTLCRICNADEVKNVLFGFEDPDDDYETRFVYLEDCKHNIESRGLEMWLTNPQDGIMLKGCPICRVPILKTQRYMNIIKIAYQDVRQVKLKSFGEDVEIEKGRLELEKKFQRIKILSIGVLMLPVWDQFLNIYKNKICTVIGNRRNTLNQLDINTLNLQIELLHGLVKAVKRVIGVLDGYSQQKLEKQILFLTDLLIHRGRYLSAPEVNDINLEVDRFYCLTQLCQIESNRGYKSQCNNPEVQRHYDVIRNKIHCWKPFTSSDREYIQRNLEKLKQILRINVSNIEREEFLKVIQMKQGRWYKCPNGHFYVITECGRPVVTSKCPECHEKIGGFNKKLLTTNKPVNLNNM